MIIVGFALFSTLTKLNMTEEIHIYRKKVLWNKIEKDEDSEAEDDSNDENIKNKNVNFVDLKKIVHQIGYIPDLEEKEINKVSIHKNVFDLMIDNNRIILDILNVVWKINYSVWIDICFKQLSHYLICFFTILKEIKYFFRYNQLNLWNQILISGFILFLSCSIIKMYINWLFKIKDSFYLEVFL